MTALVITLDEVAALLRLEPRALRSRLHRLRKEHGFPRCLPGLPGHFSAGQVEAWVELAGLHGSPSGAARTLLSDASVSASGDAQKILPPPETLPGNLVDLDIERQARALAQNWCGGEDASA